MTNFKFSKTSISNLKIISREYKNDTRGYLTRLFCQDELNKKKYNNNIKQINLTLTAKKNTLRGFHYQIKPFCETKYVTCVKGKVLDIVIDLRKKSKTFLKYHSEIIKEDDSKTILIPKGFAHGFLTLVDNCKLLYFHTANYRPKYERGINFKDPILKFKLKLKPKFISERDKNFPLLDNDFKGIEIK